MPLTMFSVVNAERDATGAEIKKFHRWLLPKNFHLFSASLHKSHKSYLLSVIKALKHCGGEVKEEKFFVSNRSRTLHSSSAAIVRSKKEAEILN